MNRCLLWGFISISLTLPTLARSEGDIKLHGENVKKIEIELDIIEGNAIISYNDIWKSKAKISYAEKKKIVAYKDEENGHCLLEKIKKRDNGEGGLYSRVYRIFETSLEKVKAEKLAGKKLVGFCSKYPIILLKEYSAVDEPETTHGNNKGRKKRESDIIRGNESHLSHQEISKKLLEDLAVADGLVGNGMFSPKGVKRNVGDGTEHGMGHHPSSSAKAGQPSTVDYHARIRNGLPSGEHPMHPIDITSSVTIATGASHPVWSYPPSASLHYGQNATGSGHQGQGTPTSHGFPHHSPSAHQNTSHHHHHHDGHHYSSDIQPQTLHQDGMSLPSSSGQPFKTSGYYPPSSTSKTQQNNAHYPPSSTSKTQPGSIHYPPSSFSKPQQSTGYYPPSSTSKTQHTPTHFSPSTGKPQQGPGVYPPSSSSKSHQTSSSLSPQPGPAYYPPSSFSKTHHNTTSSHGVHPSLAGTTLVGTQYPPSSHSIPHGYQPSYVPPSSTSKIHYTPQPQNMSHSSFHHGGMEQGRGVYASQFPPSSTSKVYHQHGTGGRSGVPQYPPSSTSKIHPTSNSNHGGPQNQQHGVAQYAPSYKIPQPGTPYAPQYAPSSTSKLHYSPAAQDSSYGTTPVLERPSARGNSHEPGSYPPSSTSKVHYSPHSHVMPATGNVQGVQYYPPSSTSKLHYSPSSSGHDHHLHSSYPPSSTSKLHHPHSVSSGSPAQIPQPPTDRNLMGNFPLSSNQPTHHPHPQHYPPSSSSKLPDGSQPVQSQHHQSPPYYPPSSTSKVHQGNGHQNFSSPKPSPSVYYPPSSTSKLHHSPNHHQDVGGRVTATGRVSITPGFNYYPQGVQQVSSSHPAQQYPYYGPSSSSHHHNQSSGIHPSSSGHERYSPPEYPPSSISKMHHPQHQNGSGVDQSKAFYPTEQYPSSSGAHHHPLHRNDSSGQFPHPSQGGYYPPSGHHQPVGGGYVPQYPPSSSSHHPQQAFGGSQPQFYQGLPPSGQSSPRPCQSSPRSLYSITTRTILTPNGAIQRPVSVKTNGEYPCGVGQVPARYAPCSGTLTRNGQAIRPQTPCAANGNFRKSMRNAVPGPAVVPERPLPQHPEMGHNIRIGNDQHQRGYVMTNAETQTELLHGVGHHHRSQFSKLQAAENSTSDGDATGPENFEENGRSGKDVEVFERNEAEDEKYRSAGKPVKYQENEESKVEEPKTNSEEEVKEGDVLEPGDKILGKDGYTILDGFRGRVVSVTGQVGKTRAEVGKVNPVNPQEAEKKSNSGQFKYSSDLGRYVKENGEKKYSNCQGEPTFTCSEFLGSNGRAKICKPNPRRNPDGSPC